MKIEGWLKHFFVYGSGMILMNAIGFLLVPIYTRAVPPSDYGALELLSRSQEILLLILSLGSRATLLTLYQMQETAAEKHALYSTAVQFLAVISAVVLLLLGLAAPTLAHWLFADPGKAHLVHLILITTYFETLFQVAVLYLQSSLQSVSYISLFTGRALLAVAVNLVLVYQWRWGLPGIVWAGLIQTGISAVVVAGMVLRQCGMRFETGLVRELLKFGLPLVPSGLAMFVLNNGDRYFLNLYSTSDAVGLYGLGYKIGMLSLTLVLFPVGKIWSVVMVDLARREDGAVALGKVATYLLVASGWCTLGIALFGPHFIRFTTTPSYWYSSRVIPIIAAAYIFYIWATIMDASFYVTKRTGYKPVILGISCAVTLLAYVWLIPRYGMVGAAWATFIGFACFAATTLGFAQKVFFIQYEYLRILYLTVTCAGLYWLGTLAPVSANPLHIGTRLAATLALPPLLWFLGFFDERERETVTDLVRRTKLRFRTTSSAQ